MNDKVPYLQDMARQIRRDIVTMISQSGDGHPAPALSCADILATLYFDTLRIDPANPGWADRDRLILSKGHACPALYAALARRADFSTEHYPRLRRRGSILQGHPDMKKTPGVDFTSGSLGNGISLGVGLALAARQQGRDSRTFVITGDGELQEGVVWEGLMSACKSRLGSLVDVVHYNGMQSGGAIGQVSGLPPIPDKFRAFGWHCQEIDGHDIVAIRAAIQTALAVPDQPSVIVAKTIKGKGVPYMEGDNSWHKKLISPADLERALAALGGPSA